MEREREEPFMNRIRDNINDLGEKIQENVNPLTQTVTDGVERVKENVDSMTSNVKENVENTLSDFSGKDLVNSGNEFLNSNSIIAKFAFVILVLILFVFLFNLGVRLISYFTSPESSPYIVKGLINGTNGMVITQDPNSSSSVTIQRSNNNKSGIEFTWSVWIYISGVGTGTLPTYSHIFNKGDSSWNTSGLASVNNGPGLYLINPKKATTNPALPAVPEMGLYVMMDTENVGNPSTTTPPPTTTPQILSITDIPIQKWFNVCIRMQNVIMDVYVNGTNSGRLTLPYVPRQNYNDVNVCQNGGFNGNLSDLRYFDHALSVYEINSLIWQGPNLAQNNRATSSLGTTYSNGMNYISNLWYTNKINNS